MSKVLVAPSILSADFAKLADEIHAVEKAGCDWIHIDVMDGHFVPNITIGAPVVKSIRKVTQMPLDVHLMIENPEKYIKDFADAGSDYITIHVESTKDPLSVLRQIRALGVKAGITLRPATSVESILPLLSEVDLVLVMTVNPGFSGQSFIDQSDKIRRVHAELLRLQSAALIEVDGGVNEKTAQLCYAAGARVFVAGNFMFKSASYEEATRRLKSCSS